MCVCVCVHSYLIVWEKMRMNRVINVIISRAYNLYMKKKGLISFNKKF